MNAPDRPFTSAIRPVAQAPALFLHCAIFSSPQRVIGDETLRLVSFSGTDTVSEPFEFQLELHGNTGAAWRQPLLYADVIGRPITVGIQSPLPDGDGDASRTDPELAKANFQSAIAGRTQYPQLALFNGIVAAFAAEQQGVYRLTMRPALWKLGLTNAYRVHAQVCIRDAIGALLREHHVDASVDALVGSDNPAANRVQDWLQAGETDDEFLRRLMSKAHVYYYFVHTGTSHTAVFANRPAYRDTLPGDRPLRYCATEFDDESLSQFDVITRWRDEHRLVSGGVHSHITRQEAASEEDAIAGLHTYRAQARRSAEVLPFHQLQVVQYGGSDAEVDHVAHTTQDALDASAREFSGASGCPHLRCGHRFGVTQLPRAGQHPAQVRPELEGSRFVATLVKHEATLDGGYRNEFSAADERGLIAAFSIHETQLGTVLGTVVSSGPAPMPSGWRYGKPGDCDPEFSHLVDRSAGTPVLQACGVMVKLATFGPDAPPVWVKLAPHMETAPQLGATVAVSRAQDQSELPEIQSIVQSNTSQVVMPSGWTAATTIGSSCSTSYGDNKSVRFGLKSGADIDGAADIVEQHYASGQYREVSYAKGGTYSHATADAGRTGLLSRSDSFGSTYSTHHGAVSSSLTEFDDSDNTSVVTGTARNVTRHAASVNESAIGTQSEMGVIGISSRLNATGDSHSLSSTLNSVDLSISGSSTSVALKGANTSIELAGVGIRADIAALRITISIPEMDITL